MPTRDFQQPASLMTLNFRQFDDVSLMPALGIMLHLRPASPLHSSLHSHNVVSLRGVVLTIAEGVLR